MKYFFFGLILVVALVVGILGFRGDKRQTTPWQMLNEMDQQQKVKAQAPSRVFADGRAARLPVAGTVPQGVPMENEYLLTGAMQGQWGDGMPVPVTAAFLARGQERYQINCAVCHGATGNGQGVAAKYGWGAISNLQQDMYRKMADGEIYNTVAYGKGTMMGYGANLSLEDRWAIVAYVRVLQRSQRTSLTDVPEAEQSTLGAK
jgi:mono/diheme cytochrome c family protein